MSDKWRMEDGVRPPPGQEYTLVTVTTENKKVPGLDCAVCVRGCFPSIEAAQAHSQRIQDAHCKLDTWIGHTNVLFPLPPDDSTVESKYGDERLDKIMHLENEARKRAADSFDKRKREAHAMGKEYTAADWVQETRPASEMDL